MRRFGASDDLTGGIEFKIPFKSRFANQLHGVINRDDRRPYHIKNITMKDTIDRAAARQPSDRWIYAYVNNTDLHDNTVDWGTTGTCFIQSCNPKQFS